jgi:hypothetical protein
MLLAILTTEAARLGARFKGHSQHLRIGCGLAGEYPARCATHLRTVKIEPDAAGEHLKVSFTKASIGTGGAGLRTIKARIDALGQRRAIHRCGVWVRFDHPLSVSYGFRVMDFSPFCSWVRWS